MRINLIVLLWLLAGIAPAWMVQDRSEPTRTTIQAPTGVTANGGVIGVPDGDK